MSCLIIGELTMTGIREYRKGRTFVRLYKLGDYYRIKSSDYGIMDIGDKGLAVSILNKIKGEFWK